MSTTTQGKKRGRKSKAEREAMRASINDQLHIDPSAMGAAFGRLAAEMTQRSNLSVVAIKVAIGFVYAYTMAIACNQVLFALALLALPAWINFVLAMLVAIVAVYATWMTITPVTNLVYNAGETAVTWLRKEYHALRGFLSEYSKEPDTPIIQGEPAVVVTTH